MVTVKLSGAAEKSDWSAVSAITRTGTVVATERAGDPGNRAVTVTRVVREAAAPASSLMRNGLTAMSTRLSSSLMVTEAEAATRPGAEACARMVSSPSADSSSTTVISKVPVTVRSLASNVISRAPSAPKSLTASAVPAPMVRVRAVSSAGGVTPAGHPA